MKKVGTYILNVILLANIVVIALLLLAAYSSYLSPDKYPILSCFGLVYMLFFALNFLFLAFWLFAKPFYAIAPAAGIVLTWSAFRLSFPINFSGEDDGKTVRILTYNAMGMAIQKPDTEESPNPIIKYIAGSGADVVCIQEYILSTNPKFLTQEDVERGLSMYPYHVEVSLDGPSKGNQLACYSKYPIIGSSSIEYPTVNNGSAVFELLIDGDTVTVINNHLESNKLTAEDKVAYTALVESPSADGIKDNLFSLARKLATAASIRAEQARAVRKVIDEHIGGPLIVCGDFNDGPLSYAHRVLNAGMRDAFASRGRGLGITYNQNKFYFRIDNILVSDAWEVVSCRVDDSIDDSDHYPVIADLRLRR